MNISRLVPGLAAAMLGLCGLGHARAAHLNVLPESARAVQGGRAVDVLIAQSEIRSNINQSHIAMVTGGGLLPALIDAKVDYDRAKKAEDFIQRLRDAMSGRDIEALALDATKASLAGIPWFQASSVTFGRDTTLAGRNAALDAATTSQVAFIEYAYDLSPDASSIEVTATIQLVNKATPTGGKPEDRFSSRHLAYLQTISSIVALPAPSRFMHANISRWVADDGKAAHQAMAAAFGEIGLLLPRALGFSEADLKAIAADDKTMASLDGYYGHLEEQPGGALLFDGTLTNVPPLQ
jgi:hypothetical protein